jgi:superfamily I DNA and/or RNA helicase
LVGLTRAQRLLVVVGYSDALKKKKFWREWLNWLYSHRANKGIKCVPALW